MSVVLYQDSLKEGKKGLKVAAAWFHSRVQAAQRAKIFEKVHKPLIMVNIINIELDGFNASIINMGPLEFLRSQLIKY